MFTKGDNIMASKLTGIHYGDGSNLTGINATTLDGIDSSKFVRNDINAQTIARHLDANTAWGGGDSLFLGWYSDKTIIGNDNHGVHNTASGYATNSIILSNPTYCHSSITASSFSGNGASLSNVNAQTLDGIDSNQFARRERSNTVSMAVGWYTIAVNEGNRASAKFHIMDTKGGRHQSVHFHASHMYGSGSAIGILHNNYYSASPMRYIRIKEGSTYDGALLQVYFDTTSSFTTTMYEDVQSSGWTVLASPVADGTNPGGVNNFAALTNIAAQVDIDLCGRGGVVTTGNIHAQGDVTAYSDSRLKENVQHIEGALDKVSKLNGYTYDRTDTGETQAGVIAQEVLNVMPELVRGSEESLYTVAYGNMAGLFIEAIKEMSTKIESLEAELKELKK